MYTKQELIEIITDFRTGERETYSRLVKQAIANRDRFYGRKVFLRGLIEFSSYCRCDCAYCGLRRSNPDASRYRLNEDEIIATARYGYERVGFRSFVLQSGEDSYYTAGRIGRIILGIKQECPGAAVTLSLGERPREDYAAFREAGADRYLLRHETANDTHYARLHPREQTLAKRIECLHILKKLGFQLGAGFMVGSPWQTDENLAEDLLLLNELRPHMVGIGPFIPHRGTPLAGHPAGSTELTRLMMVLVHNMLPEVLLPATTALGSLDIAQRDIALTEGANVIMPSLTPSEHRGDYLLYNGKMISGDETVEFVDKLCGGIAALGLEPDFGRGDSVWAI